MRQVDAGSRVRILDQAGAVEAREGLATVDVGDAGQAQSDGHDVRTRGVHGGLTSGDIARGGVSTRLRTGSSRIGLSGGRGGGSRGGRGGFGSGGRGRVLLGGPCDVGNLNRGHIIDRDGRGVQVRALRLRLRGRRGGVRNAGGDRSQRNTGCRREGDRTSCGGGVEALDHGVGQRATCQAVTRSRLRSLHSCSPCFPARLAVGFGREVRLGWRASPLGSEEPRLGSPRETKFPLYPSSHFGCRIGGWSDDRYSL